MKFYFLLILAGFYSCSTTSVENKIQGRWNLKIIEYLDTETGNWTQSTWMKNGTGILEYNPDGRMNVHFTPENFENYPSPIDTISGLEKIAELQFLSSDYWYIGNYKLVENESHVTHKRIMHSNPWDWGVLVKRKLDFLGDTLVLTSTERETNLRLKWVR